MINKKNKNRLYAEAEPIDFNDPKNAKLITWYNEEKERVDVLAQQSLDLAINFLRWLVMGGLTIMGIMSALRGESGDIGTLCSNMALRIGVVALGLGILCGGLGLYGYVDLRKRIVVQRLRDINAALKNGGNIVQGGEIYVNPFFRKCRIISFFSFSVIGMVVYLISR